MSYINLSNAFLHFIFCCILNIFTDKTDFCSISGGKPAFKTELSSKDLILIKPSLVDINRQFSSISIEITFSVGFSPHFKDGFTRGSVVFPCELHGVCGLVRSVLDVRCCLSVRKNTRSLAQMLWIQRSRDGTLQ